MPWTYRSASVLKKVKTWPLIVVGAHIPEEGSEHNPPGRSIRWLAELFLCPTW